MAKKLTIALFVVYIIALFWILLLKLGVQFSYMEQRSVNLVPFRETLLSKGKADVGQVVLNILIFIPLGIYAGVLFKGWSFAKHFSFFVFTSFIIEALQLILKTGAFDITDIITNSSGAVIGWLLLKAIEKGFKSESRSQKLVNVVGAAGTIVIISLLLLLKLNMLPVRYQ